MGPALIQLDERGYWQWLEYRIDGRLPRPESEGPAVLQRRVTDGRPIYEAYNLNDSPHRDDRPAVISYGLDGRVTSQAFWRHGEFLSENIFASDEGAGDGS